MPFLGLGQLQAESSLLQAIQRSSSWPQWPATWRRGLASAVRVTAPGAWTPPEGMGHVANNLASMLKRMDQLRPQAGDLPALGLELSRTAEGITTYRRRRPV